MQIDRALATRLATVLKLVMHGKTLPVAAAEAGVSAHEIDRIVKALERELWTLAREAGVDANTDPHTRVTAPATPAPKPRKKRSGAQERMLPKLEPRGTKGARAGLALVAYADGGSRGNPGESACAALITTADGDELLRRAKRLGKTTNNVAEYEAVLLALDLCRELGAAHVTLRVDSELVARQIEGQYKVRHPDLMQFHHRVVLRKRMFESVKIEHIPRKENAVADAMVNACLDDKELD